MNEKWNTTHTIEQAAFVRSEMIILRAAATQAGLHDKITPASSNRNQAFCRSSSGEIAKVSKSKLQKEKTLERRSL